MEVAVVAFEGDFMAVVLAFVVLHDGGNPSVLVGFGLKDSVRVARAATPGQAPSRYVPEVAKARCDLGLEVLIDLTTSVQKTVQWCKKSN